MKPTEIGKGRAIIYCCNCGMVLGVWYNAEEGQEVLGDSFCVECHNRGVVDTLRDN